jgi:hypothetical protein
MIGVNPERLPTPLYGDDAKLRVGSPGTLLGNVATYVMLNECFRRQYGKVEPVLARVMIREIDGQVYLVVAPAEKEGKDVYPIKFDSSTKAPTVRGLKLLFAEAAISLRSELWYEMPAEIVQDEMVGWAVAGNWTTATTRPRPEAEAAAAEQNS